MKNRSRHEIIATMLGEVAANTTRGASRTTIMYRSFLSHAQLKQFVSLLLERGLIEQHQKEDTGEKENERTSYNITHKGLQLLQTYNKINNMISYSKK